MFCPLLIFSNTQQVGTTFLDTVCEPIIYAKQSLVIYYFFCKKPFFGLVRATSDTNCGPRSCAQALTGINGHASDHIPFIPQRTHGGVFLPDLTCHFQFRHHVQQTMCSTQYSNASNGFLDRLQKGVKQPGVASEDVFWPCDRHVQDKCIFVAPAKGHKQNVCTLVTSPFGMLLTSISNGKDRQVLPRKDLPQLTQYMSIFCTWVSASEYKLSCEKSLPE